jgi:CRISPR-associated protein Cmr5
MAGNTRQNKQGAVSENPAEVLDAGITPPDPSGITRQQRRAQFAYNCVSSRNEGDKEYSQLAKKFPALVHNCGLAQAIAFVQAKEGVTGEAYLAHLTRTMGEVGDIGTSSRSADLMKYQRLTREVIDSASWLKRYSEALLEND